MSIYSTRKSKSNKKGPSGAPGPASATRRSPWRAKWETESVNIFVAVEGGPFEEKKFIGKSHNAEKLKGRPFGIFKHPMCCKISKKLKGGPSGEKKILEKKVSQCRETEKVAPFGIFQHPFCRKTAKKLKGGPFKEKIFFPKKSLAVPKKLEGETLWCRPVWYVTRKNRKNLFGSVR